MELPRRRGGGGGAAVSKNVPAATRHADAFGAPQHKFASGQLDDYAEIFGDLAGSCSIPFLDLQPALEGLAPPAAGFDYSEVFGGLDFGEFAAPCEQLFAAPRREVTVPARSANGRIMEETTSSQQATAELNFSTKHSNEGYMTNREADWSSSNSNCSDNGSMRLNVSQKKSTKESKEATLNAKTNAAQFNDIPAPSFVIDTPSSIQNIGGDGPCDISSDGIDIRRQQKIISVKSTDNSRCPENTMHADQNNLTNSRPVSKDGHANASNHSRSSSGSFSSGDASSSNVTYVTVSDISLRTQPLGVPPPSRPPPRSSDKQGYPKPRILSSPIVCLDEVALSKPVTKDHVHQEVVKDNSPSFFDVEIDVSSAAAASAAAMKEAMEQAQAKLKSAKEMMERKRDSLQNSRKLGNYESVKRKERKLGQVSIGQESFEENLAASQKINEATSAAKLTQHCKEKETVEVLTKKDEQSRQRKDLKSYKVSKSVDQSEKWETNKEYHELVNNDKHEMTEEVFEREGSMKKVKLMTIFCKSKQNDSIKDALVYEIESDRNLRKENSVVAPSVDEENADLEADGSHVEEVEKLKEIHKLHGQEVRETEVLSFTGSDKKMKHADDSKIDFTFDDEGGKSKLEAALSTYEGESSSNFLEINESKEGNEEKEKTAAAKCHGEKIQKEINTANEVSNSSDDEGKLNVTNATVVEKEIELQVPQRSCTSIVEGNEGACKCTYSEKTQIEEKQCNAQNVEPLEGTIAVHEQEKKEELHMKQQSCLSSENELRCKVDQETTKLEEDISEWKSSVGATACNEQVELMKATKVVCWQDCNGDNAKESQLELQHRDTKEDEFPESCNQENFEGQNVYEKELSGSGNEGIVEIQIQHDFMDKVISVDPVISRRPPNMALGCQPTNLSREGSNLSIVSMKRDPMTSQKIISYINKAEEQEKGRVQMEKQEKRLEEEKKEEKIQEENEVKTNLLEERKEVERKLEEDMETARLFEKVKERERKLEEEKEQARLLEEAKERERKLKEEKEQARLLEEAIERERKLENEKERARLLEEAKERERMLKEEKEQARLLEAAKEKGRKLTEQKEQARLLEEAKERERKLKEEKEQAKSLEEAKEREKKLEEKEQARLLEKTKRREKKIVDEQSNFSEERGRKGRKLEEEKDRARLSEEGKDNERKLEEERAKLLEKVKEWEKKQQEKEREREREKDRAAVERATREAHERAFAEARERADRIAVERITSEVWQRALKEAQEKAEKASSESREKSLADKVSREARLRAERAAVERATAEARERAAERALAGKAAADARERAERYNGTSRDCMRKDTVTEVHLKAKDKDGPHDGQLCSTNALSSNQANYDSNDRCEGESVLRCKARLERHQRIAERAAKALAEKNTRDVLAQREQAERDRLSEFLDADVKRWSNGKEGNLRALLSTLQYILGPESGWQPIPLTDVITAVAVKKAYRKATLCVHPDKLQQRGASIQQKYICEKVFDLLKEAWNRFNSEER